MTNTMITHAIMVGLMAIIPVLTFIGLTIAALVQERKIVNYKRELLLKDATIRELESKLNNVKSLTREDVDLLVEQNKALEFKVKDLRQLREMDKETRQRLISKNEELNELLNNFKMDENIERMQTLVKLYLDSMSDKVRKMN